MIIISQRNRVVNRKLEFCGMLGLIKRKAGVISDGKEIKNMNELKVFQNSEFGELGVLTIDGKEYFPATQCAKILGYAKPADAVKKHCKGVSKIQTPTNGGIQQLNYISEGDLYRLIVRSKLPSAEKFERWVFDEVLPELRRTGSYGSNINLEEVIAKTATAVVSEHMLL